MRLAHRLLAGLAVVFLVVGAVAGAVSYVIESSRARRRLELIGGMVAGQVFDRIEVQMRRHRGPLEPEFFGTLSFPPPVRRVFLVNRRGLVRATTDPALGGRTLSRRDEGCRACHGAAAPSVSLGPLLRWARPVALAASCRDCHAAAQGPLGCLVIDLELSDALAEVGREMAAGLLPLAAVFGLAALAALALTRRWVLLRIEALAGLARRFEQGDLTARAQVSARDEIAAVEGGFNRMAEALQAREAERAALLERLRATNEELLRGEERTRRAYDTQRVLNEVLRLSLGGQPLDAVLQRCLDLLLGIPWLAVQTRGSVFVAEGRHLALRAQTGLDPVLLERCRVVPFGHCLCGLAAERGRLVHAPDVDADHATHYPGMLPHGHYCVPILGSNREVRGVLNLYLSSGHPAKPEETDFLASVAATLAGVIERHRAQAERERLIGELQQLLAQISASHQQWQGTFDGITDLISILDAENRIVKVNRAFAAHFGLHPRELLGRSCVEFCLLGRGEAGSCPLCASALGGGTVTEEGIEPRTGRVFRLTVFPYSSGGGGVDRFVHLAEDVTEVRENEERLIMSERLAALGQMASGIAHEINNPLASIAGCAEALLGRIERERIEPGIFKEYLGIVQEEVFRCKGITTAMLSFVRKGSYEVGPVRLDAAVDRALELIGFQGRLRSVEVVRSYAENLPPVRASEGELRQVLLAVVTNALDAMQERGTLRCAVEAADGRVVVTIADSGPGIPAEVLPRIFTPFFTTKGERGGTGLGLSIARRIVADLGGALSIESAQGEGTAVRISFPAL